MGLLPQKNRNIKRVAKRKVTLTSWSFCTGDGKTVLYNDLRRFEETNGVRLGAGGAAAASAARCSFLERRRSARTPTHESSTELNTPAERLWDTGRVREIAIGWSVDFDQWVGL